MSIDIPSFILSEATLSFYGLGIRPPGTSWGLMLATAQAFAGVNGLAERWWIFIPWSIYFYKRIDLESSWVMGCVMLLILRAENSYLVQ